MFLGSRQGYHLSPRKGHGLEFSDFRAYAPGDDFRHIDWGVYARTDRLYVRQFREEQDLNVICIIDASASMGCPPEEEKFSLAGQIALALGYVALTDGDRVTFCLLGKTNSPHYQGVRSIGRAVHFLSGVKPSGTFEMSAEVRAAIAYQKTPGRCFLISDFLLPMEKITQSLAMLREKNFEVSLIQILSPSELRLDTSIEASVLQDSETGESVELSLSDQSRVEYATMLGDHLTNLESYCSRNGISQLLVSSADDLQDIVFSKLPAVGILH